MLENRYNSGPDCLVGYPVLFNDLWSWTEDGVKEERKLSFHVTNLRATEAF